MKIQDKDRLIVNGRLAEVKVSLNDIAEKGVVTQWLKIYKGADVTGDLLMDVEFYFKAVI